MKQINNTMIIVLCSFLCFFTEWALSDPSVKTIKITGQAIDSQAISSNLPSISTVDLSDLSGKQNEWLYCTFTDQDDKKIREIETKPLHEDFEALFSEFAKNQSFSDSSWCTRMGVSRSIYNLSQKEFKKVDINIGLKDEKGRAISETVLRPVIEGFLKEIITTKFYSNAFEQVKSIAKQCLPREAIPDELIQLEIFGPIGGLALGLIHTDGVGRDSFLGQVFLATDHPTTIFPFISDQLESNLKDIGCQDGAHCEDEDCPYCTLIKKGQGFSARKNTLCVVSGAVAHCGPKVFSTDSLRKRALIGAKIKLSAKLQQALYQSERMDQFLNVYWGDYFAPTPQPVF
ncbi:hypothetical protein [Candidatus Sororendozoicomonas aggregata]|uniref:hypothetical protein n=1 Tax=Candidatus Sororendozoicomonas aggregata TaxID=3073239 RepID=UPI002ED467D0